MKRVIGRWILFLIAVPVAVSLLGSAADKLERDRGRHSRSAKGVRAVRGVVRKAA